MRAWSFVRSEMGAVSDQLSAIGCQLSAVSYRLSAFSYQRSAVSVNPKAESGPLWLSAYFGRSKQNLDQQGKHPIMPMESHSQVLSSSLPARPRRAGCAGIYLE